MIDPLYKRPLKFKMNAVLLASGLSVGLTKCYFLPGHPGWSGYLTCFIVGYFASVTVALLAGALSVHLLDMDFKADFERVTIIAGLALIVASLLLLFGQLSGGSLDDSD